MDWITLAYIVAGAVGGIVAERVRNRISSGKPPLIDPENKFVVDDLFRAWLLKTFPGGGPSSGPLPTPAPVVPSPVSPNDAFMQALTTLFKQLLEQQAQQHQVLLQIIGDKKPKE